MSLSAIKSEIFYFILFHQFYIIFHKQGSLILPKLLTKLEVVIEKPKHANFSSRSLSHTRCQKVFVHLGCQKSGNKEGERMKKKLSERSEPVRNVRQQQIARKTEEKQKELYNMSAAGTKIHTRAPGYTMAGSSGSGGSRSRGRFQLQVH